MIHSLKESGSANFALPLSVKKAGKSVGRIKYSMDFPYLQHRFPVGIS